MLLIGQYLSPFTRRVAVALRHYGIAYNHEEWSAFSDPERIAGFNPALRVPVLVLDGGEALIESAAILDYLDELSQTGDALIAPRGPERRRVLHICALAGALCDKAIAIIYEKRNHAAVSESWLRRCEDQISGVLGALEADRASRKTPFWFGERLSHADVAVTVAITFLKHVNDGFAARREWPALDEFAACCERIPEFAATAPRPPK